MANHVWARLDGPLTSSHPIATVLEVTQPLDAALVPGKTIFVGMSFVDVSSVADIAPYWTTTDGTTFTPPVPGTAPPTAIVAPATVAQLLAYADGKQGTVLAQVWSFNVGTAKVPLVLTTRLDESGQNAMTRLATWGMLNAAALYATDPYSNVDLSPATLTAAQATLMANLANAIVSQSRGVLNGLVAGIKAAPPTITTLARIDDAGWPSP